MQLHEIKSKKRKDRKRVGRGGKKGTYSGRGMKGQNARAGANLAPVVRELVKAYPKLRGIKFRGRAIKRVAVLNLDAIEKNLDAGVVITPELLVERKIVDKLKGRTPAVKILGDGDVTKAFTIERCAVSKSAKAKIEKAGGKVQ